VSVVGARTDGDAERAARRIANSMLVKTAIFGGDANWGRILQTIGAARVGGPSRAHDRAARRVVVFRSGATAGPGRARPRPPRARGPGGADRGRLGLGRAAAQIFTWRSQLRLRADQRGVHD